jgi:hypothetical protein
MHRLGDLLMAGQAKAERGKAAGSVHRRPPLGTPEGAAARRFAAVRAHAIFGTVR